MADFCDELENKVRSLSAVTDLIGASAACRFFPDVPNQAAVLPFMVYAESGGDSEEHLQNSAGMCRTVLQVWAFGSTRRQANKVAETFRRAIKPEKDKKWGELYVTEISCSTHRMCDVDLPQDNQDQKRYWTRRTFDIWHEELV